MGEQELHEWLVILGILGPIVAVLGGIWMSRLGALIGLYLWQRHERECREEFYRDVQRVFHYGNNG